MHKPRGPGQNSLRKGRHSRPEGVYFITFSTEKRVPWFQEFDLARIMSFCMQDDTCLLDSRNLCWVVMPDHVHVLIQLGDTTLSKVVRKLKATSALRLNRTIGRAGRFWSPGFHDHGLRKEEDLREIGRYIVGNPLRAKLAARIGDYPFWNAIWV